MINQTTTVHKSKKPSCYDWLEAILKAMIDYTENLSARMKDELQVKILHNHLPNYLINNNEKAKIRQTGISADDYTNKYKLDN